MRTAWTAVTRGWTQAHPVVRVRAVTRAGTVTLGRAARQAPVMPPEAVTRVRAVTRGWRVAVTLAGTRARTRGWLAAVTLAGMPAWIRGRARAVAPPTRRDWTCE